MAQTVKITDLEGNEQIIEVDNLSNLKIDGLELTQEWTLKAKNSNQEVEVYEFIGERTSREER